VFKTGLLGSRTTTKLHYEVVLEGEMPEEDYDLLIDTIKRYVEEPGMAGTVGRILTWTSKSNRGRHLEVTVIPRQGRTILRVSESAKPIHQAIFGAFLGLGTVLGGGFFAVIAGGPGSNLDAALAGLVGWGGVIVLSGLFARGTADTVNWGREDKLTELIEELAVQARESIELKRQPS
jgi:hypothetical protein